MNKATLKRRFKKIYGAGFRLLAVQLDGFSHAVVFDTGKKSGQVFKDSFSHCMPEGKWSSQAAAFFHDIGNSSYQGNPL